MPRDAITWVLHDGAIAEGDVHALAQAIRRQGMHLETVRLIPFEHKPAGALPDIAGACVVYGSSGLLKLAKRLEWSPGGWDGPAFGADIVMNRLGALSLNAGGRIAVWSKSVAVAREMGWNPVFVRPVSEDKEFPGRVLSLDELDSWVNGLAACGYLDNGDTPALVSPVLSIGREWRFFVVDGIQISSCQYAIAGTLALQRGAPDAVSEFVERAMTLYQPAPCFVIDVAEVVEGNDGGLKIVEFNSINSAGFYRCDIDRIVDRLGAYIRRCC